MSVARNKLTSGGCACASCQNTDSYRLKGFDSWPRGNPSGKKASSEYAAHVAFANSGGVQRAIPASLFDSHPYACRASSEREIQAVLIKTFAPSTMTGTYKLDGGDNG